MQQFYKTIKIQLFWCWTSKRLLRSGPKNFDTIFSQLFLKHPAAFSCSEFHNLLRDMLQEYKTDLMEF